MGQYRISRNIEASFIDYIVDQLALASWNNIAVEKSFARVMKAGIPAICVRVEDTDHSKIEVGSNSTRRAVTVLIDVFATDDGGRLDLKDFLISVVKHGMPYYEYTITNGAVDTKTQNGRLTVTNMTDSIVNLNVDKDDLDTIDRYRHLITLTVSTDKVEL